MAAIYFTAILETIDGEFLEKGWACLSTETNSIDFKNDFVPLLQIGTMVRITRTLNDEKLQSFSGEVYVASKNFLRITAVSERELNKIRPLFESNIWCYSYPALYRRSFLPFSLKKTDRIDATIYYISNTELHYLSMDSVEIGQILIVSADKPLCMDHVKIEVEQIVEFGGIATCYLCKILEIGRTASSNIKNYLVKLAEEANETKQTAQV